MLGAAGAAVSHAARASENVAAPLNIFVPGPVGGGLDRVAQALGQAARTVLNPPNIRFEYAPGESGLTGLARFLSRRGQGGQILVASLSLMGTGLAVKPGLRLAEATPIARVDNERLLIVAPKSSPFRTFNDLMKAVEAGPERLTFAGGAVGGVDHLLAAAVAAARGIDLRRLSFLPVANFGFSRTVALEEKASCAIGVLRDFEEGLKAGGINVLAASDAAGLPMPAVDLRDPASGVEFEAWRGIFAPPGIKPEQQAQLAILIEQLTASPEWEDEATKNRWSAIRSRDLSFADFIVSEEDKVQRRLRAMGVG